VDFGWFLAGFAVVLVFWWVPLGGCWISSDIIWSVFRGFEWRFGTRSINSVGEAKRGRISIAVDFHR